MYSVSRQKYNRGILVLLLMVLAPLAGLSAKKNWSVSSVFSYTTGTYIYDSRVDNYTLYLGGRYSHDDFSVSLTLPLVIQRDQLAGETSSPGPSVSMENGYAFTSGVSDIYLYTEYKVYPSLYVTGQVKAPTSLNGSLFSSGKFDYGLGLAFRKMFGVYRIFADAGYLMLGDPGQIDYENPFVYGIGLARHAPNGRSTVSFYYQEYSTIIKGLKPPRQLSAAYFRALNKTLGISFYGSKGFGESSAEYTLAIGFNVLI
ncbi:MAG TPA: hypothetical protein ENJ15_04935 [Caldithrix abyssi]|uniref:Transporter n=1 Tax=Caldithrix abyssi TaxID=187145 RepID=A0A7V5RPI6_CALAY|nr:hypothetical protein [Caldithrix abyssi]